MHRIIVVAALAAAVLAARPTHACGGLVQSDTGSVQQTAQQALIVVQGGNTDVVLTLQVPGAGTDFGVLVPVPSEPTIDADPVSTEAFNELETATRPEIVLPSTGSGGGGCGCATDSVGGGFNSRGIEFGEPVAVGPVTAQWLSGESGAAVADWLTEHGFELPGGAGPLLDAYVAQGMSFLAFTKTDAAADVPERLGVHFTLAGDHRAYAMRMTRLGGVAPMTFSIFVATDVGVSPDAPWVGLRIQDLDRDLLVDDLYEDAVMKGVADNDGQAFVVETILPSDDILAAATAESGLADLLPAGLIVTRMLTIVDPTQLGDDATFTADAPDDVGQLISIGSIAAGGGGGSSFSWRFDPTLLLFTLALAAVVAARARRELVMVRSAV